MSYYDEILVLLMLIPQVVDQLAGCTLFTKFDIH